MRIDTGMAIFKVEYFHSILLQREVDYHKQLNECKDMTLESRNIINHLLMANQILQEEYKELYDEVL